MYLPDIFKEFQNNHPEILDAFQKVGDLCAQAGPLDAKALHLIQMGIAIGSESKGSVKSHARRALALGVSEEELRQVVLSATTVVGFPAMIAAYGWVEEVLSAPERK